MPTKIAPSRGATSPTTRPSAGSAWGNDPAFTVADAAVAVGVSRKAMYDYIAAKRIGHVKIGGQVRIRRSQIDAFIEKGTVAAV